MPRSNTQETKSAAELLAIRSAAQSVPMSATILDQRLERFDLAQSDALPHPAAGGSVDGAAPKATQRDPGIPPGADLLYSCRPKRRGDQPQPRQGR